MFCLVNVKTQFMIYRVLENHKKGFRQTFELLNPLTLYEEAHAQILELNNK